MVIIEQELYEYGIKDTVACNDQREDGEAGEEERTETIKKKEIEEITERCVRTRVRFKGGSH